MLKSSAPPTYLNLEVSTLALKNQYEIVLNIVNFFFIVHDANKTYKKTDAGDLKNSIKPIALIVRYVILHNNS